MRLLCTAILWSILAASVAQYLAVPWDHARPVRVSDQGRGIFRRPLGCPERPDPRLASDNLPAPGLTPAALNDKPTATPRTSTSSSAPTRGTTAPSDGMQTSRPTDRAKTSRSR
ncbi:uncharacterized protein [Bemisia tabaci]|uniref:uncharacterized protein n=1 Tax=Bemisia tabaci TaxID=7038 RepID=UPI003B2869EE